MISSRDIKEMLKKIEQKDIYYDLEKSNMKKIEDRAKNKILKEIEYTILENFKVKYLPITNQLILYKNDSKISNYNSIVSILKKKFTDLEYVCIQEGNYPYYHKHILINKFLDNYESKKEIDFKLILVTYAKKSADKELNKRVHYGAQTENKFAPNGFDYSIELEEKIKNNLKENYCSTWYLKHTIESLKQLSREEQRHEIYKILRPFDGIGSAGFGTVEVILNKISQIDVNQLDFDSESYNFFHIPDNDIRIRFDSQITNEIKPESFFSSKLDSLNRNEIKPHRLFTDSLKTQTQFKTECPIIKELGINVTEFNELYRDKYIIQKGDEFLLKGFWLVYDSEKKECGMFFEENGFELEETSFSKGKYKFIQTLGTSFKLCK